MNLPIDLSKVRFMATDDPEVAISWETKLPQTSAETGEVIWKIRTLVSAEGMQSEIIWLKVPGEPKGLKALGFFKPIGLRVKDWETQSGHGFAYRADSVQLEGAVKAS